MEGLTGKRKKDWEAYLAYSLRLEQTTAVDQKIKTESKTEKARRIKFLLHPKNFDKFIDYYFSGEDFKPAPLGWFHWEAIKNVFIKKKRKHVWEWHRESAKSVFANIFIGTHKLVDGTLTGMMLASETRDKAEVLLADIEAQLRNNARLIHDFGDFGISGTWAQGHFQTNKGIGFWAFGIGQNPAGVRKGFKRPNLGIVDDADNKDKAKNETLTEERVDWINGEFLGCLAKDDRCFIYVNNRVHEKGITARMVGDVEEGDKIDPSIAHIKVCLTENPITHEPIYFNYGTEEEILADLIAQGAQPAWKEYYSLEDCVAKIVDYGKSNAMRQMYHLRVKEGTIFNDGNMPWADMHPLQDYDALVSYCDPAFGESGKGCYKGIVLLGKKGHYYDVIYVWLRQKGNWIEAHRHLAEHPDLIEFIDVDPDKLSEVISKTKHYVEANSLQESELKKSYKIENLAHDKPWYPKFDDDSKPDKIGRIEALETTFDHMHIRFNIKMKGVKDMTELRDQFKGFPSGFIDGPDTLHGAKTKIDTKIRQSSKKVRLGNFFKKGYRRR